MTSIATSYLNRRLPWGTPWWPYAATIAAANFTRQVIQPDDISTAMEATVFVVMIVAVIGVVTLVHMALRGGMRPKPSETRAGDAIPPEIEVVHTVAPGVGVEHEGPSASVDGREHRQLRAEKSDRWAPWWWYVAIILGVNYLRQGIMPVGTVPEWAVVLIALAISAVLFVVITMVYRGTRQRAGSDR
jgi:OPT oligopeptide transporter protein